MAQNNDWWKQGATAVDSAMPSGDWWKQGASPMGDDKPAGGAVSDALKSFKSGVEQLPGMATGIADLAPALAFNARPFTKAADAIGEATGFQPGKWAKETQYSPNEQAAQQESQQVYKPFEDAVADPTKSKSDALSALASSAPDIAKFYATHPLHTINQAIQSVPAMLAGGAASKLAMGAGALAGVAADPVAGLAARAAVPSFLERAVGSKLAAPVAGGIGEGAMQTGQQMDQGSDLPDQRKNAIASLASGATDALISAGGGRLANKMGLETPETLMAKGLKNRTQAVGGLARNVVGGALSEGALQELPQSMQEQVWQNYAEGKPLMEGVVQQGIEGGLAGGLMGAGANIRGHGGEHAPAPEQVQAPVEQASGEQAPPLALGNTPDPLISFPDGSVARQSEVDTYLNSLPEEQRAAARAKLMGLAPQPTDIGTSPGAADPNAPQSEAATAPQALEATTAPGAAPDGGNGVDFTREFDTAGLNLQDPAEAERARAATVDYAPTDTTPNWGTAQGAAPERQGLDMPAPEFDTSGLSLDRRTPSQRMGIDPTAGPLSSAAAMAVDSGAHAQVQQAQALQDAAKVAQKQAPSLTQQAQAATQNVAPPANLSEGLARIRAQRQEAANAQAATQQATAPTGAVPTARTSAMEAAGSAPVSPTTTGVTNGPEAAQAQQSIAQPTQAGDAARPAATSAPNATGPAGGRGLQAAGVSDAATAQNDGAQGQAAAGAAGTAPAPQAAVARPDGWRKSMLRAVPVAKGLGIDHKGKRLAQLVAEIDAADAQRAGVQQDGADLSAGKIDREWSAFAPETETLGVPRAEMPQIRAVHRGALVNFLKARGIDSRAGEMPANDLKPTQAEFSPAKVEKARAFPGGDRSILVSSDGYVVDGHHQWLARRANGEPVKVIRLQAPIREVLAQTAEFPSVAAASGAQSTQGAPDAVSPRNLRLADERAPGAAAPAQDGAGGPAAGAAPAVGAGQRHGAGTAESGAAVRAAVPDAGGAGQPAGGVAPQGREVFRDIGKYKEGRSEPNANQLRSELARKNPGVVYTVEEDPALKNGYAVVGREPAPGKKLGVEKMQAAKGRAPVQFSRTQSTQSAYEARIDALFAGGEAGRVGVRVLDRSDVLGLLGHPDQPVILAEGKVRQGQDNHQRMTAETWKKVPEWLENPAAVFASDTVPGRLVFIAPEMVNGSPVRMIVEPDAKVGGLQVHLLVNAFDATGRTPWMRWAADGLARYIDKNKFPAILAPSGLQLSRVEQASRGTGRILTEKQLAGYRRANNAAFSLDSTGGKMSPELAQALTNIRPPERATKESVHAAVREVVNGLGRLPNGLGRIVVATSSEIKQDWEPLIGGVSMEAGGDAGKAQGFYDPNTKTVFLIADHIRAGDELGVVAHELMHKHGQAVLGEAGWNQLHGAIAGWANAPDGSLERKVYDEAAARVQKSRPTGAADQEYSSQELFPYAVQVALEEGVRPNILAKPGTVARWLAQVRSALRSVWAKISTKPDLFNSQDLVNLAFGIAQRENPEHAGALDGVTSEAGNALAALSRVDELFQTPKSQGKTVAEIAADVDPAIKVRRVPGLPGRQDFKLTMANGKTVSLMVAPTGLSRYQFDYVDGEATDSLIERPGENPEDVPPGTGDVWIDVSALESGEGGREVYAIAANFAHNNGMIFIGDPAGLSDEAMRRRPEQMLSSALKYGTTAHLAPHPRQVSGDSRLGIPPLKWVYGDDLGNIRRLIDLNLKALDNAGHGDDSIRFDPADATFRDSGDGEISRAGIDAVAQAGIGRGSRAGGSTLARRAVLASLVRSEGQAQRGADGRPDGLLENVLRLADQSLPSVKGLFYSRAGGPSVGASRTSHIESSMGEMTPAQEAAYKKVAGVQKVPTARERLDTFKANLGLKMKQALVDQFAPIQDVSQQAYMLARMSKGSDGATEALLLYGKPYLRDGVLDVNIKDGGFAKVLAGLKGEHDRFFMWVAAQRAERLKAEGKENLMGDEDITALRSLNAGKMADGTVRMPIYAKALQELNAFNEASLKVAQESGLIDQEAYDLMKDQPYVPFYRLMEEQGGMTGPRFSSGLLNQKAWKKLKGGTQQLNADLMQNSLLNWSHLYAAAARNRAALATMDAAEGMGVAYKVGSETKGAVKVMRDGVSEHWMIEDPYLLEAVSALNYSSSPLMKPLSSLKKLLTWGVTVNPAFKIRNLIRDSIAAVAQSPLGFNPAANVARGLKLTATDSQVYASMLASGGIIKFGTQENSERLREQVAKLGGVMLDKDGLHQFTSKLKGLYEAYQEIGDRTENVNRAALYDQLIKKGYNHADASFMARDLMDFSMSGSHPAVRFLTQTVPFLNARLQGLYKLGRAAKEDPKKFAAVVGAVSLASLGLLAAYSDDDDWKKREDWDRDSYWWFKIGDTAYRIPKPFEVGAIGTIAERTAELMFDKEMTNKRFMDRLGFMVGQTFSFDPTPQAIKPLLDIYANKDSFTQRDIESQADQRLRPQDRYNERTSEVARLLGSLGLPDPGQLVKGDYAALSPKQVDYLLHGYFSWVATSAAMVSDFGLRPVMGRGERPDLRLKDVFLAGNFVESLPAGSSRYVTQLYDQAKSIEQAYASYQEAIKQGDTEKALSIKEGEGDKLRKRMAYANATKQLSEINSQAKRIESNRLMSGEVKRERLTELELRRDKIARRVASLT